VPPEYRDAVLASAGAHELRYQTLLCCRHHEEQRVALSALTAGVGPSDPYAV